MNNLSDLEELDSNIKAFISDIKNLPNQVEEDIMDAAFKSTDFDKDESILYKDDYQNKLQIIKRKLLSTITKSTTTLSTLKSNIQEYLLSDPTIANAYVRTIKKLITIDIKEANIIIDNWSIDQSLEHKVIISEIYSEAKSFFTSLKSFLSEIDKHSKSDDPSQLNFSNDVGEEKTKSKSQKIISSAIWEGIKLEEASPILKKLTILKKRDGKAFLTNEELDVFINSVFIDKKISKIKLEFQKGDLKVFYSIFHHLYRYCYANVDSTISIVPFIQLIDDHFEYARKSYKGIKNYFKPNKLLTEKELEKRLTA